MVIIGNLNCNQAKGKNILKSRQLVIETRYVAFISRCFIIEDSNKDKINIMRSFIPKNKQKR